MFGAKGETRTLTSLRYQNLNLARLPIPPLSQMFLPDLFRTDQGHIDIYSMPEFRAPAIRRPVYGVDDGDRTHDNKNHNLALYQLSYAHHNLARPAGFEPATLGLAYQLRLSTPQPGVCGLDYLFTISGVARIVSTEPS